MQGDLATIAGMFLLVSQFDSYIGFVMHPSVTTFHTHKQIASMFSLTSTIINNYMALLSIIEKMLTISAVLSLTSLIDTNYISRLDKSEPLSPMKGLCVPTIRCLNVGGVTTYRPATYCRAINGERDSKLEYCICVINFICKWKICAYFSTPGSQRVNKKSGKY